MTLFEAGILAKMTTDEYKNLPEQARRSDPVTESDKQSSDVMGDSAAASQVSITYLLILYYYLYNKQRIFEVFGEGHY